MIPDDILRADAAGRIPDEISLEYLAESRDHEAIVWMLVILVFSVIIIFLRCYARLFVVRAFGLDDVLALACIPFFISTVALGVVLINLGSGRHYDYIQYVMAMDNSKVNLTQILDVAARMMYITALVICRGSVLAFYIRLASQHPKLKILIIATAVFVVATYIPQFFLILFHCTPVTGLWPYDWQPEYDDYECLNWGNVYITSGALSIACDVALLIIPIWLIALLQVDRRRKILLSLVLLPGIGVLALSCVRIYIIYIGTFTADFSWNYNPQLVVEAGEVGGTLIALSVPGLKPLLGKWGSKITSAITSHSLNSRATGSVVSNTRYFSKGKGAVSRDEDTYELSKPAVEESVYSIGGGDRSLTPPDP